MHASRKRLQRLDRRVHIRGLGIVVVLHAANSSNVFQPVSHRFEVPDCGPNFLGVAFQQSSTANRRQNIFKIVSAFEWNFIDRNDFHFRPIPSECYLPVSDGRACHFFLAAEPEHVGASASTEFNTGWIVGV